MTTQLNVSWTTVCLIFKKGCEFVLNKISLEGLVHFRQLARTNLLWNPPLKPDIIHVWSSCSKIIENASSTSVIFFLDHSIRKCRGTWTHLVFWTSHNTKKAFMPRGTVSGLKDTPRLFQIISTMRECDHLHISVRSVIPAKCVPTMKIGRQSRCSLSYTHAHTTFISPQWSARRSAKVSRITMWGEQKRERWGLFVCVCEYTRYKTTCGWWLGWRQRSLAERVKLPDAHLDNTPLGSWAKHT